MTATATWAGLGVLACLAGAAVVGIALGRLWATSRLPEPGWVRYHNHPAVPGFVQAVHAGLVGPHVVHCDHHQQSGRIVVRFADDTTLLLDDDLEQTPPTVLSRGRPHRARGRTSTSHPSHTGTTAPPYTTA